MLAAMLVAAFPVERYVAAPAGVRLRWLRLVETLFYCAGGIDPARQQG